MKGRDTLLSLAAGLIIAYASLIGACLGEVISLKPGESVTIAATQPVVAEPTVPTLHLHAEVVDDEPRLVVRLDKPSVLPLVVNVKTKAKDVVAGIIPAGQQELPLSRHGDDPINWGWQYWAYIEPGKEGMVQVPPKPVVQQPPPPVEAGEPLPADRVLRSGTTYTFDVKDGTVRIPANAHDIKVVNSTFDNTLVAMNEGSLYRNIEFRNCLFKNYLRRGDAYGNIYQTVKSDGLRVIDCVFVDGDAWAVLAHHWDNLVIEGNLFDNIKQGVHLVSPGKNASFSYNYGRRLLRMMAEVQGSGGDGFRCEGNVALDWRAPFHDTFGLSIIQANSTNIRVVGNYLRMNRLGPWSEGKRAGYAIEIGGDGAVVASNVIVGGEYDGKSETWVRLVANSGRNTRISGNRIYSIVPAWGYFGNQPSVWGSQCSFTEHQNIIESTHTGAPPPPAYPLR